MTHKKILQYSYELITYASNLENVNITLGQTYKLITDMKQNNLSTHDTSIVLNLYQTYKKIINEEITLDTKKPILTLMEINKLIGESIIFNNGKIRDFSVQIKGSTYIPPKVDTNQINDLILNNLYTISIDNILFNMISMMKMQPFGYGNKRSSTIFSNLLLSLHYNKILLITPEKIETFRTLFIKSYEDETQKEVLIDFLKECLV
ncbi:hypothetical protein [Mycoplasma procyoni]|uniref:hypothetical protein n=1 Tax=Mycoplasma procyoni TaxID=568784 RepID=UPI00197B07EF|nr:hypothetical protein [Mycoplasma procyoni]MBN3534959.1 hypothetical protein [Mycoplasma procyoni]